MPDTERASPSLAPPADLASLRRERQQLLALIEILQQITGSLHFVDIVQAVTQKLGETFGLDRCSIFLAERGGRTARLVASYEDPTIRNYVVDLERYPELKQSLQSGETVFIADAQADPNLRHIRGALENRKVRSITVVPIVWRRVVIGAIFLRTFRDGKPFSDHDLKFTQTVGAVTAKALRAAYRYDKLARRPVEQNDAARRADLERVALMAFLRRFLDAVTRRQGSHGEDRLGQVSIEEIDRLVEIAVAVLAEEGKGR